MESFGNIYVQDLGKVVYFLQMYAGLGSLLQNIALYTYFKQVINH